jgi:hypothetical protein
MRLRFAVRVREVEQLSDEGRDGRGGLDVHGVACVQCVAQKEDVRGLLHGAAGQNPAAGRSDALQPVLIEMHVGQQQPGTVAPAADRLHFEGRKNSSNSSGIGGTGARIGGGCSGLDDVECKRTGMPTSRWQCVQCASGCAVAAGVPVAFRREDERPRRRQRWHTTNCGGARGMQAR